MTSHKRPWSLGHRLLVASLILLPLYLTVTGMYLSRSFQASQQAAAETRLRGLFYSLLGALEFEGEIPTPAARLREPRLFQWHSGLYAWVSRPDGTLLWRSPSSQALLDRPWQDSPPSPGHSRFQILGNSGLLRYQYQVIWQDNDGREHPLLLTLAEDDSVISAETGTFNRQLWLGLGGAAILLTLGQWWILRWGLRPLRRLSHDLTDLERGQRATLDTSYPKELQPLADNLNSLLEQEASQRNRYRNALADLAHSLKTPLAVLQQLNPTDDRQAFTEQLERMDRIVAYQLGRAVSGGGFRMGGQQPLKPLLHELNGALAKVHVDKSPSIETAIADDVALAADRDDLLEVFGNLLDNACKACRHRVRIQARRYGNQWQIEVDDDGPGIIPEQRLQLLQRGQRGDSYRNGQGIGLAVVTDLLDSYGAKLDIKQSPLGGACFEIRWPAGSSIPS